MSIFNGIRQKLRGGADAGRGDQPYPQFKPLAKIPGMAPTRNASSRGPLPRLPFTPSSAPAPAPATFDPEVLKGADRTIANATNANRSMKLAPWTGDLTKMPNESARNEHFAVRMNIDSINKATNVRNEQLNLLEQKRKADIQGQMMFKIPGDPSSGTRKNA